MRPGTGAGDEGGAPIDSPSITARSSSRTLEGWAFARRNTGRPAATRKAGADLTRHPATISPAVKSDSPRSRSPMSSASLESALATDARPSAVDARRDVAKNLKVSKQENLPQDSWSVGRRVSNTCSRGNREVNEQQALRVRDLPHRSARIHRDQQAAPKADSKTC
jgi:hypothetical protein